MRATNEEIIQAYRDTGSVWKAAMRLGLCGQSVHERLRKMGIKMMNQQWTDDEIEVVKSLSVSGFPISDIAARLGRTYAGVACKMGELKIAHPYKTPKKVKRGIGLTKKFVMARAKELIISGDLVTRFARKHHLGTTSFVDALQRYVPEIWGKYLAKHAMHPPRQCPGCGNNFTPLSGKQRACSTKCSSNARSDVKYFGGKRRNTVGLAQGICQLCGQKGKSLSSHHLFGKLNDPENDYLIALCTGCHHVVGILGRFKDSLSESAFWENLISLVVCRAWADKGERAAGTYVCVDIEKLDTEKVEEEIEALPAGAIWKNGVIKDSQLLF